MILNLKLPEAGVAIVTDLTALATIALIETHWLSLAPDVQRYTPRGDEVRPEYARLRSSGLVKVVGVVWWEEMTSPRMQFLGVSSQIKRQMRTIITDKGSGAFLKICAELQGASWPPADPKPKVDVPDSSVG